MPWKTIDGEKIISDKEPQMRVLIEGMLNKKVLLDLIHHFVVFEKTKSETLKKLAAYHQYYAVNKAVECTIKAMKYKPIPSPPALLPNKKDIPSPLNPLSQWRGEKKRSGVIGGLWLRTIIEAGFIFQGL